MLAVPIFQLASSYLISSQDSTRSTGWRSPNGLLMSSFKSFTTLNVQITITIMIAVIMIMILILIMIIVMIMITIMIMMIIIYLICMHGYTHSLEYVHSYLDYLQKLIHILTLFIIFLVQYD